MTLYLFISAVMTCKGNSRKILQFSFPCSRPDPFWTTLIFLGFSQQQSVVVVLAKAMILTRRNK